ncbi:DUF3422 family protein [Arhodomonas sp. SL1]|uniref:DUF3422 family protein n=1 Tax=Arhodomonas sp. SL1 TaxID=3425691 RepID=UPI003F88383A
MNGQSPPGRDPTGLTPHPLRPELLGEAHARPFEMLRAPLQVAQIALYTGTDGTGEPDADPTAAVTRLCRLLNAPAPDEGAGHWVIDAPGCRIRWERHTEFVTYTFLMGDGGPTPFAAHPLRHAPAEWLDSLPGDLLAACDLWLTEAGTVQTDSEAVPQYFRSESLAGSHCAGGAASAWTDFHPDECGFIRFLVVDHGLRGAQGGRVVQRLLEIETYRMMALLAFPRARAMNPDIEAMEDELGALTGELADPGNPEEEHALLDTLSRLSARVERTIATTSFRFSATEAYATLVRRRIEALRERRIEGVATIDEFMERRFAPAVATCRATGERLDRLSRRVSRAANLLRTRVDVALEAQNRDLLASMNRRARLQLRLQQTVEGLSVVILSYYSVSLVGYAAKAVKAAGVPISAELITGLSIPVVVAVVGWGLLRLRRRVEAADQPD